MKKTEILRRIDDLKLLKKELFEMMADASAEKLQTRPAKGKWSPLQILCHMQMAEQGTLSYIQKKLSFSTNGLPKATLLSSAKVLLLRLVLRSPIKFKAPRGLDAVPENPSLESILLSWKRTDDDFQGLVNSLEESQLSWQLFKHPIIGRLGMKDTLLFMKSHFTHHARQIRSLLS